MYYDNRCDMYICRSEFCNCYVGARQGGNISPLLFSLFINDTPSYLSKYYSVLNHIGLDYCKHWNLNINTSKRNVLVFSKGKIRKST